MTLSGSMSFVKCTTATLYITCETAEECDSLLHMAKNKGRKSPTELQRWWLQRLWSNGEKKCLCWVWKASKWGREEQLYWGVAMRSPGTERLPGRGRASQRRVHEQSENVLMFVRQTRCEQDKFGSERHTPPFSLVSVPHLSCPSCQEKKKHIFSFTWQWRMPSQEVKRCLTYLVKGGEWAAALDSVTF